jgi:tetratricopeptide (TPR) repeat protein
MRVGAQVRITFLTRAKQIDKAIEQFNIALRLFPNFALVYSDRGNALEKLDKLDEAMAAGSE